MGEDPEKVLRDGYSYSFQRPFEDLGCPLM